MKVTLYVHVEHLIERTQQRLASYLERHGKCTEDLEKAKSALVQDPRSIQDLELMVTLSSGDVEGSKADLALLEAAREYAGDVKVEIEI